MHLDAVVDFNRSFFICHARRKYVWMQVDVRSRAKRIIPVNRHRKSICNHHSKDSTTDAVCAAGGASTAVMALYRLVCAFLLSRLAIRFNFQVSTSWPSRSYCSFLPSFLPSFLHSSYCRIWSIRHLWPARPHYTGHSIIVVHVTMYYLDGTEHSIHWTTSVVRLCDPDVSSIRLYVWEMDMRNEEPAQGLTVWYTFIFIVR
jgi:hypothetical protein